jgi:hypothetical protein
MPPLFSRARTVRANALGALLVGAVGLACFHVAACSSSEDPDSKKSALKQDSGSNVSPPASAEPPFTPPHAAGDASVPITAGDAGPVIGNCPAGTICLDVSSVRPNGKPLPGRLAVLWVQLNRQGADPLPEVAYDVPFLGTETTVQIPTASITPPSDRNMLCTRECDDETYCPCTADPRVGVGYVLVVNDANMNGKADFGATSDVSEPVLGVGVAGIAYSAKAFKPAPAVEYDYQVTFPMLFTQGIELGIGVHTLVPAPATGYDAMGAIAPQGTHFKLPVCDSLDPYTCAASWPTYP